MESYVGKGCRNFLIFHMQTHEKFFEYAEPFSREI